jgi:arylsulfatase A-like enzyme
VGARATAVLARQVVIVSVDTLRADRLEVYGYARPTSPNLSALARRSIIFDAAQAQSSQTAPSHASLFTSEYVGTHGISNVHGHATEMPTLPAGVITLAELASQGGLETAAFVSGGNLTRGMHMNRGFDVWNERNEDVSGRIGAFMEWMGKSERGRFLGVVHTYQVHAPYVPPAAEAARFTDPGYSGRLRSRYDRYLQMSAPEAWAGGVGPDYWEGMLEFTAADVGFLSDLYDAEIAYADAALRPLLEALLTGDRARDTALIVLSDHGEEFRDHGKFQHDQVYEELIRVPLLIHLPTGLERAGWNGRVVRPVELVDVAPTVAELLGIEWKQTGWVGESLVDLMRPGAGEPVGPSGAAERRLQEADAGAARFSELVVGAGPKVYRSVSWRGWKYINAHQADLDARWEWLYDLESDPGERMNLVNAVDGESVGMRRLLKERLAVHVEQCAVRAARVGDVGSAEVSAEHREELQQLGYVK